MWLSFSRENLEETFQLNVLAVHNVTKAFLPLLRAGKEKRIVNMWESLSESEISADLQVHYIWEHVSLGDDGSCSHPSIQDHQGGT